MISDLTKNIIAERRFQFRYGLNFKLDAPSILASGSKAWILIVDIEDTLLSSFPWGEIKFKLFADTIKQKILLLMAIIRKFG